MLGVCGWREGKQGGGGGGYFATEFVFGDEKVPVLF